MLPFPSTILLQCGAYASFNIPSTIGDGTSPSTCIKSVFNPTAKFRRDGETQSKIAIAVHAGVAKRNVSESDTNVRKRGFDGKQNHAVIASAVPMHIQINMRSEEFPQ